MAITLNRWEAAEIVVPTGGWDMEFDEDGQAALTMTLTAGTYTWATFLTEFATQLTNNGAAVYTCTLSDGDGGTGKVTVSNATATDFEINEIDADPWALCGFSGDLTPAASSHTGTNHAKGVWLPDCGYTCKLAWGDEEDESDMSVLESPDATNVSSITYNRKRVMPPVSYKLITRARARIAGESATGESWAQFWRDVLNGDASYLTIGKVRVFPDADTSATYYDYWIGEGKKDEKPIAVREGWQGLFEIVIPRMVRVET